MLLDCSIAFTSRVPHLVAAKAHVVSRSTLLARLCPRGGVDAGVDRQSMPPAGGAAGGVRVRGAQLRCNSHAAGHHYARARARAGALVAPGRPPWCAVLPAASPPCITAEGRTLPSMWAPCQGGSPHACIMRSARSRNGLQHREAGRFAAAEAHKRVDMHGSLACLGAQATTTTASGSSWSVA